MLTKLPKGLFKGFTKLETLKLSNNLITDLHGDMFNGTKNLVHLTMYHNMLTKLPKGLFEGLAKLETLQLRNNLITDLHEDMFNGTKSLVYLTMYYNMLKTVPKGLFKGLIKLKTLKLSNNLITDLHEDVFKESKNLVYLTIYQNMLTRLPRGLFKGLTKLQKLKFSNNLITDLHGDMFNESINLIYLTMYRNMLTRLPSGLFKGLRKLQTLKIYYNNLISLEEGILDETIKLTELNLSYNNLTVLPSGLFKRLTELDYINLRRNNLGSLEEELFNETRELTEVDLSYNNLTILPIRLLKGLAKLESLQIKNNYLTMFPIELLEDLQTLRKIRIDENQIASIDEDLFSKTKELNYISIRGNKFNTVPKGLFRGLQELTHLFIYDLPLQSVHSTIFHDLINLEALDLGRVQFAQLNSDLFKGLHKLQILDLNGNKLTYLGNHVFKGLRDLETLLLHFNQLQSLELDIFQYTANLIFLDLSGNELTNIPNINNLIHLRYINLRENTLTMISISMFSGLKNRTETIVSQTEICECYVPPNTICTSLEVRSPYLTCDRLLSDTTLVILMWLIGLNALGGNTFVLIWRKGQPERNNVQSFILSNLALSDLLMGIYMLLIASADIYFGENFPMQAETWRSGITCRIAGTISILSSEASVFFVTLISIDRFINIKYPFSRRTLAKKSSIVAVLLLWLIAMTLGLIPSILAGRSFKFYDNSHVCVGLPLALIEMSNKSVSHERLNDDGFNYDSYSVHSQSLGEVPGLYFSTAMFLGLNCICYLIILICYVEIVRVVYKSSKRVGLNKEMREQVKMTAKVAAVVLTDFFCWFPIILLGILVQTKVLKLPPSVFAWCVTFVLPINSAINPYLYTIAQLISNYRSKNISKGGKKQRTLSLNMRESDHSSTTT